MWLFFSLWKSKTKKAHWLGREDDTTVERAPPSPGRWGGGGYGEKETRVRQTERSLEMLEYE